MSDELITTPYGEHGVSFAFESFGRRIAISLGDPSLLPGVLDVLPPGWSPTGPSNIGRRLRVERLFETESGVSAHGYTLCEDDERRHWATDANSAIAQIESMVERDVAEFADPWLFLHAGVVAWRGEAILLPGVSHAGKSTLTAALVEAGATYFSDEYAVLSADGRVLPFPRRLSLRDGPLGPTGRLDLRHRGSLPSQLAQPLPIGRVYVLRYRQASGLRVDTLSPGSAIMELCQHMVAIQRRPQDVLAVLNKTTRAIQVLSGERGDARETAHWILHAETVKSRIMTGIGAVLPGGQAKTRDNRTSRGAGSHAVTGRGASTTT